MNITQNLERSYKSFIDREQPFDFFKGLAEYLDYVFSVPELKQVFDQQLDERRVLYKQIEETERKTRQELDKAKKKLLTLIKKTGVDVASFERYLTYSINDKTALLQELEAYENRTILGSVFVSDEIERHLFDITANLLKAGYKEELGEFIESPREYAIHNRGNGPGQYLQFGEQDGYFIFSKTLSERREKESNFERERMLKPWGSFEALFQFDIAYKFATSVNISLALSPPSGTEKTSWFGTAKERNKIFSMAQEIQRLAESQLDFHSMVNTRFEKVHAGELKNLKQITLRNAAQTAHNHLLQVIEGVVKNEDEALIKPKIKFDPLVGTLRCGEVIHAFQRGEKGEKERLILFKKLWEGRRFIKKGIEKIQGKSWPPAFLAAKLNITNDADTFSHNEKARDKFFGIIKGINRILKDKKFPVHIERKNGIQLVIIEK